MRREIEIERHARTAMARQQLGDAGVLVSPIGPERRHIMGRKGALQTLSRERQPLIDEAGNAPRRSGVNENRPAGLLQACQSFRRKRLVREAARWRSARRFCRLGAGRTGNREQCRSRNAQSRQQRT